MKPFAFFLILLFATVSALLKSQTTHPTVENVKVIYKAPTQGTATATAFNMSGVPEASVTLKTIVNVSKVHFKIQSVITNSVIYQVNYSLNSAPVFNAQGKKLYENNSGAVFISSGTPLPVQPYTIKVQTEDTTQTLSPVFTIIQ